MDMHDMYAWYPQRSEKGTGFPGTRVTAGFWGVSCGCWKLKQGPLVAISEDLREDIWGWWRHEKVEEGSATVSVDMREWSPTRPAEGVFFGKIRSQDSSMAQRVKNLLCKPGILNPIPNPNTVGEKQRHKAVLCPPQVYHDTREHAHTSSTHKQ